MEQGTGKLLGKYINHDFNHFVRGGLNKTQFYRNRKMLVLAHDFFFSAELMKWKDSLDEKVKHHIKCKIIFSFPCYSAGVINL